MLSFAAEVTKNEIRGFQPDEITATRLAVDRQVKQCQNPKTQFADYEKS